MGTSLQRTRSECAWNTIGILIVEARLPERIRASFVSGLSKHKN
jgi:hypothetical protein